ncbi:MAG: sensor histidine kinase [Clostridiales bacterium]|nr:histidine kinase [Bacillota bacterium]NLK04604.1 sensor histidine kinase [Clostridiales bacterium]
MNELFDKTLLFISCMVIYVMNDNNLYAVIPAILTILISCLSYYFENDRMSLFGCLIFALVCIIKPSYIIFLPILLYDIIHSKYQAYAMIIIFLFIINNRYYSLSIFTLTILILLFTIHLKLKTYKFETLQSEYNELRDSSSSYSQLLEEKNRSILKNQDYEINLATLNERNRISKDIHDSIGHLLSRAILQVGALLTITRDKTTHEELSKLKNSLSLGMDDIRNSIHNMYDESVDLYSQIKQIIKEFTFCKVNFEYDITNTPPIALRYCFISITKEALANIIKHSNASQANITIREHPALYQLIIRDNGTISKQNNDQISNIQKSLEYRDGLGIRNISDRVKGFNGNLNISTEDGFKIFITIPKSKPINE